MKFVQGCNFFWPTLYIVFEIYDKPWSAFPKSVNNFYEIDTKVNLKCHKMTKLISVSKEHRQLLF